MSWPPLSITNQPQSLECARSVNTLPPGRGLGFTSSTTLGKSSPEYPLRPPPHVVERKRPRTQSKESDSPRLREIEEEEEEEEEEELTSKIRKIFQDKKVAEKKANELRSESKIILDQNSKLRDLLKVTKKKKEELNEEKEELEVELGKSKKVNENLRRALKSLKQEKESQNKKFTLLKSKFIEVVKGIENIQDTVFITSPMDMIYRLKKLITENKPYTIQDWVDVNTGHQENINNFMAANSKQPKIPILNENDDADSTCSSSSFSSASVRIPVQREQTDHSSQEYD